MKNFLLILIFIGFLQFPISASENIYDVEKIPVLLRLDGRAVTRVDEKIFDIEDANNASLKVKYAVTIFNVDQQHYGNIRLWYDKFRTIAELDGAIYNSKGELIRELEDDDIMDFSDFDGYSIYSDNRVKIAELYHSNFPYTVEFYYELEYNGHFTWPTWYSRINLDPVELASFQVITPPSFNLRYWCNTDSLNPEINIREGKKSYTWKAENLTRLTSDANNEDIDDLAIVVRIAPSEFEMDGYSGNMESWNSFGQWFYKLSKGRDVLPESARKEISELLDTVRGNHQKIETLYHYMQSRTRYVSVQLGIGGWQPFDAEYVYKNGYGDCKALSNYMVALLKYAEISAYPVLIANGNYNNPLVTDFPSNQFNHVIVCVPQTDDTVWLECTSQVMQPGYIGYSNENRNALLISSEGGIIVRTPSSKADKNSLLKEVVVSISSSGSAKVNSKILFFGNQYTNAIHLIKQATPQQKDKWIRSIFEVPDLELQDFRFHEIKSDEPCIELEIDVMLNRYGAVSGSRIFFNPNLIERRTKIPKENPERLSPISFKYPYLDIDSIKYELPKYYKIEALPQEKNIEASFGKFKSYSTKISDNEILFIRSLEISTYFIPAENYSEYQKFFAEVVKADKQQIVLVKQ